MMQKKRSAETGAVMLEFVFSGLFFFVFIFLAIESLHFGYTVLTAEYILSSVGRLASVRQPLHGALDPWSIPPVIKAESADRGERAQAIRNDIQRMQQTYGIDFTTPGRNTLTICPLPPAVCRPDPRGDAGEPNQYIRLELAHDFQFVVFGPRFTSVTRVIFKNEHYEAPTS